MRTLQEPNVGEREKSSEEGGALPSDAVEVRVDGADERYWAESSGASKAGKSLGKTCE